MSTAAEISPGSADAQALQDAIQQDLISRGYSVEGDEVMAEFVFVMLCNHKKPEQISTELSDLIGPDFDPNFTNWLFHAVKQYFPNSKQAQSGGDVAPASASTATAATVPPPEDVPMDFNYTPSSQAGPSQTQLRSGSARGGPRGSDPFGLYNKAISGVKRPHDFGNRDDRQQRQRLDGPPVNAPTGPKFPQPTDGLASAGPPKRENQRNLIDRVGPPPGTIPVMSPMGPALYNPQSGTFMPPPADFGRHNGRRGREDRDQNQQQQMMFAPGAVPFFIPPGMVPQFPQGGIFPPQMLAQFQQQMGNLPQSSPQGQNPPENTNGFQPFQAAPAQPFKTVQEVPSKPSDDSLCKYATECKNAYCKFAHPSPAATKESGLVLSDEPCEKQLECKDADCPKSHISPQAKDPANSRAPPAHEYGGVPRPSRHPSYHAPPATGGKLCKFGAGCTRPDCAFTHPWDKSATPCRFGAACTRPDCHFSHPPRHNPYRPRSFGPPKGANRTAVFNNPSGSSVSVSDKLAATEAEKAALSERMKKFAVADGETEKIIPGAPEAQKPPQENGKPTTGTAIEVDEPAVVKKEEL